MSITYKVRPLRLGSLDIDKSYNTYMKNAGEEITQPILAYLVSGGGKNYLVDTGAPDEDYCTRYQRPIRREASETLLGQLDANGLRPEHLDGAILTHLHWDHAGNVKDLGAVTHYVQAEELRYAIAPMPIHSRGYDAPQHREPHVPFWIGPHYEVLDGATELAPGLSVVPTPGHSPGSQTVLVQTSGGVAALTGDTVPLYENWETNTPNTIHTELRAYYQSLSFIRTSCDYILPGHDERVLDRTEY